MVESSPLTGVLIVLFIVIFGLVIHFLVSPLKRIKRRQKLVEVELISQEKKLLKLNKKVDKKKNVVEGISKKIKKAREKLGGLNEVKKLRITLMEERKKSHKLEMKIKKLKHNIKVEKSKELVEKSKTPKADDNTEAEKIKQKYPGLPKNQLERIEIERSLARALMRNNGGSFYVSQILKKIEGLYPRHIRPNDRIMLLNEIKSWIERDPLCKDVKTTDEIQQYTFI